MKLAYNIKQRKRASTCIALAESEIEASRTLLDEALYREAVVHLFYACFYMTHALLSDRLDQRASHRRVEAKLHEVYGKGTVVPRRYVDLHTRLHKQRTETQYRSSHTPPPSALKRDFRFVQFYYKKAVSLLEPIEYADVMADLVVENQATIRDFSVDVYCPKTYFHHTRFTIWFPPSYAGIFTIPVLTGKVKRLLRSLRVRKSVDYVAGLNSKVDQYKDNHLLMLDIDSFDPEVEASLNDIGGTLFKTGRGYHFVGRHVIEGRKEWEKRMKGFLRHPVLKSRIDRDHVTISLQRGYTTLRVTTSPIKPSAPRFFKEF